MAIENTKPLEQLYELSSIPMCVIDRLGKTLCSFPKSPPLNKCMIERFFRKFDSLPYGAFHPMVLAEENSYFLGFAELTQEEYLIFGPVKQSKNYRIFVNTLSLAIFFCTGRTIPPEDILLDNTREPGQEPENALWEWLFLQRESSISHIPHSFERGIFDAVETGDVQLLKKRLAEPTLGHIGKMSNNTLQQERYTFVVFASLLARAAIRGGVEDEMAYSLTDTWCRQMDSMNTIQDINGLSYKMAFDFCQRIASEGKKSGVSHTIQKICSYISTHLHEEICLIDLSALSGLCSRSLSIKFREIFGVSIVDYIHQQKMKEAAHLLRHSDYEIADIADLLNYCSQSYFSKVFHDIYGITPKQYREQQHITKGKVEKNKC
jgi:AraC-like DNA-binding protein